MFGCGVLEGDSEGEAQSLSAYFVGAAVALVLPGDAHGLGPFGRRRLAVRTLTMRMALRSVAGTRWRVCQRASFAARASIRRVLNFTSTKSTR